MSKLKIEHGASKVRWVLLKTNIEESIANELDLMCEWSENERKYIVNELLRFGLAQSEGFQKYKTERESNASKPAIETKPLASVARPTSDTASKAAVPTSSGASRQQSTGS